MYSKLLLAFAALLLFSVAANTPAQSLGEVARQCRKEREAREKNGEAPVKVFTNDDIDKMPPIAILESSSQTPSSPETRLSAPSQPSEAATSPSGNERKGEKSKEFWQARFKVARTRLAHAKEEEGLVEDELRLLQIQQARELSPNRSRKLNGKIDATTIELDAKRAAAKKAQEAMAQLEKEFKDSGAPKDWVQGGTQPD